MSKFKQKFALLRRNTVVREIAGQMFTFYPISITMLFDMKTCMEPLMKGLKVLFAKGGNDGAQTVEETRDPVTGKVLQRLTHIGPPDPTVLKLRNEQQDAATKAAIEAVLGESNRMLLGRVLADSLRDEGIRTDDEVREFITDPAFDLPLLMEFLGGFFAVNTKVFGPFAERVRTMVKEKMADLTQKQTGQSQDDSASADQEVSPASVNPFGTVGPMPS